MDALFKPLPAKGKAQALFVRLRQAIESQRLQPNVQLPSSRSLAQALGVSRNVVLRVYARLDAMGYVHAAQGSGTRVSALERSTPSTRPPSPVRPKSANLRRPRFDFRFARVAQDDKTQEHWISRIRHHAARSLNHYSDPQGLAPLREQVAKFLARYRNIHVTAQQILLVSGSQQAIDLVSRCYARPAQPVFVEDPAYQDALDVMRLNHLKVQPIPVDNQGMMVKGLPTTSAASRGQGKLVFCTPSHQIPTGAVMTQARRLALLDWATQHRGLVLEDDYDALPSYGATLEPAALFTLDQSDRVLHTGTFSLVLFPGIRIGYICASNDQIQQLTRARWVSTRQNPELLQAALCDLMQSGQFDLHLRRRRLMLTGKRQWLIDQVARELRDRASIQGEKAGTFLILQLHTRAVRALSRALLQDSHLGIEILPRLRRGSGASKRGVLRLVMCYSALSRYQIEAGVARIARLVSLHG